jgi:hypothetical protein
MQSSTVTGARTLLMLVCMIVLPILAVVGTGWTRYFDFGPKPETGSERNLAGKALPTGAPAGNQPLVGSGQPSSAVLAVNSGLPPAPRWNSETSATASPATRPNVPPASAAPAAASPPPAAPLQAGAPREMPEARDWFTAIQQRLRGLGATYYLLETWGTNGELYRFHCKMAVAGNQGFTRHFEATDSSASRAMQSVLEQVEGWRAGKLR